MMATSPRKEYVIGRHREAVPRGEASPGRIAASIVSEGDRTGVEVLLFDPLPPAAFEQLTHDIQAAVNRALFGASAAGVRP